MEKEERSGWPNSIDVHKLIEVIESDSFLTPRDLATKLKCTQRNVLRYLHELGFANEFGR